MSAAELSRTLGQPKHDRKPGRPSKAIIQRGCGHDASTRVKHPMARYQALSQDSGCARPIPTYPREAWSLGPDHRRSPLACVNDRMPSTHPSSGLALCSAVVSSACRPTTKSCFGRPGRRRRTLGHRRGVSGRRHHTIHRREANRDRCPSLSSNDFRRTPTYQRSQKQHHAITNLVGRNRS